MRVGEIKVSVSIANPMSAIVYTRPYNDIITVYDEVVGPNGQSWRRSGIVVGEATFLVVCYTGLSTITGYNR